MDRKVRERKDAGNCFEMVRCTGVKHDSMLRVLKGMACQSGTTRNEFCIKRKHKCSIVTAPLLHHPCNHGPFSPIDAQLKSDTSPYRSSFCMICKMKELYVNPLARLDAAVVGALDDPLEQISFDGASSIASMDGLSSDALSYSIGDSSFDHGQIEDTASSSDGSSPMRWSLNRNERPSSVALSRALKSAMASDHVVWEDKNEKGLMERLEIEMMKERFAKLLLGEDMSGGGKGACTALAISNAITNLSASVFSELWRLEPLSLGRKAMWHREMEWILSVADYIVELVPSWQNYPNGSVEVMVTRPRSDLHMSLPALRKLDTMLVECLDSFNKTEFWYVDQGLMLAEDEHVEKLSLPRQEEKWWLPTPKVPVDGLSIEARRKLKHQRDCINQILKAAMAINSQILSEMKVPDAYWEALPKSGKASLGENMYKHIASEYFSSEALLSSLDLNSDHDALELINRIEAAIHLWRRNKLYKQTVATEKDSRFIAKSSWSIVKDLMMDLDRRELLANRSESLLLCLKQRYPGLPQTFLDILKIQYNTDVGQSILESYSRVLECLAFNIMALVDDVLHVDGLTKHALTSPATRTQKALSEQNQDILVPNTTPHATPTISPTQSPNAQKAPNSLYLGE